MRGSRIAYYSRRAPILLAVILPIAAATAAAPPGGNGDHELDDVGCGRAKAARRLLLPDRTPADDWSNAAYLEAMGETDVLHYELDLEATDLNVASHTCTITGSNRMTIQSKVAQLSSFTFQLHGNYTVTSALVNDTIPVVVDSGAAPNRVVYFDTTFGLDETFTLTIDYTGTSVSYGFGSIEVRDQSGTPIVSTLSEPYFAQTWWPTKDGEAYTYGDNSDKATIDISVTVQDDLVVVSNGLLESVEVLSENRSKYNWSSDYPIAAYLVAFSATNYTVWVEDYVHPNGVMPVEFYIYPSMDTPSNRAQWEKAIDMLGVFAPLYGEYPFINEKYGIYYFEFGGGMEHQTATGQGGFSEALTSHELAHQWWGDMITCKTWSDIWLNEGFAEYSECLWAEFKSGAPDPAAYHSAILARKPSSVAGTVYVDPAETHDYLRIFNYDLSYLKGAWVLHQLRHVVGNRTFFEILTEYRTTYEYSAASTEDFVAVASASHGQDLSWFFDEWVYGKGAPSYRCGWDTVNVNGQDYLHVKVKQEQPWPYPPVFEMPVDLVVTVDGIPETITVWNDTRSQWFVTALEGAPSTVQFDPDEWILRTSSINQRLRLGDLDEDNDVDDDDSVLFGDCFTEAGGQLATGCEPVDFDGDSDVDCVDRVQFDLAWTEPATPPLFEQCLPVQVPTVSEGGLALMTVAFIAALALSPGQRRSAVAEVRKADFPHGRAR